MTQNEVRNPVHNSTGSIDCEVNHPSFGWIPFTASKDDCELHGRELHSELLDGIHGDIAPYVEHVTTLEEKSENVRTDRDNLLLRVDAFASNPLRWGSLATEDKDAVTIYRQKLLDVPQQDSFPDNVEWPAKPSAIL